MEVTKEAEELGIIMSSDEIELGMICAIKATNREVLIDAINKMILYIPDGRYPYLHVLLSGEQLGCDGCSAEYKTEADMPYHSVPCACGNPKHWLIKYDKE